MNTMNAVRFFLNRSITKRIFISVLRPERTFNNFSKVKETVLPSKLLRFKLLQLQRPVIIRSFSQKRGKTKKEIELQSLLLYLSSLGIVMLGVAYAGVPLYRIFCQRMGLGGLYTQGYDMAKVSTMKPVEDRIIKVKFEADAASRLQWNFRPLQSEVNVKPGETALAFFTARNATDKPVVGISTYNILPYEAGPYFNKIQCFCFEDQLLNPKEQVDLPVFFYIDPEYADDPGLEFVDEILLSYIFFPSKEGFIVPTPNFLQPKENVQ